MLRSASAHDLLFESAKEVLSISSPNPLRISFGKPPSCAYAGFGRPCEHGRRRVFGLPRPFFLLGSLSQPETQGGESMKQHSGDGYSHGGQGTVIFVGHARLPQSLAPVGASPVVSVEIEVDMQRRRAVEVAARGVLPRGGGGLR